MSLGPSAPDGAVATPGSSASVHQRLAGRLRRHLAQGQHRTTYYLVLNNVVGAGTGFLFWLVMTRLGGLDAAVVGVGYTVVALGTGVGLVAKGGLDTALLQKVPGAGHAHGRALFLLAFLVGGGAAVGLTAATALAARAGGPSLQLGALGWALVAATAVLLVLTWLQDAYFVSLGRPRFSLERNLVLSAGRLLLPVPVLALAVVHPVPVTWTLALAASALAAAGRARRLPRRDGRRVPAREFLGSATRNVSGSAAEFLPGLLLAPLVLALDGPAAAAYFGIAWTMAALLFQASAAIGRSALAQMIHAGPEGWGAAIRRGALQHLWLVMPLALGVGVLAPQVLSLFGDAYARQGAPVLVLLCASVLFVAPVSLYLALLRAHDGSIHLVTFPAAMILSLAAWAPPLDARFGIRGVAAAWLLSVAPLGLHAAWRLSRVARGVMLPAVPVAGRADLE